MFKGKDFEINKDVYDRAMTHNGYIDNNDMDKLFSISQLCGNGVYSPKAYEKDGKYFCSFWLGDSCD